MEKYDCPIARTPLVYTNVHPSFVYINDSAEKHTVQAMNLHNRVLLFNLVVDGAHLSSRLVSYG